MSSIAPLTLENLAKVPLRSPSLPLASPVHAKTDHPASHFAPQQAPPPILPSASIATRAIVANERDGALFSPSLASLLFSYEQNGAGDKDLLKALLAAKCKEDEVSQKGGWRTVSES